MRVQPIQFGMINSDFFAFSEILKDGTWSSYVNKARLYQHHTVQPWINVFVYFLLQFSQAGNDDSGVSYGNGCLWILKLEMWSLKYLKPKCMCI